MNRADSYALLKYFNLLNHKSFTSNLFLMIKMEEFAKKVQYYKKVKILIVLVILDVIITSVIINLN